MQRVEGAHGNWKWVQGTREHRRDQLKEGNSVQERACVLAMGAPEPTRMEAIPNLILKEPTSDHRFFPK